MRLPAILIFVIFIIITVESNRVVLFHVGYNFYNVRYELKRNEKRDLAGIVGAASSGP